MRPPTHQDAGFARAEAFDALDAGRQDLRPDPRELDRSLTVFEELGFRPRSPVALRDFAESRPMLELDLFAQSSIRFRELWARSEVVSLGDLSVRIAGIDDTDRPEAACGARARLPRYRGARGNAGEARIMKEELTEIGRLEADWESTRRRQLTLGLAATPAERLAWLESMIALAWASGALPRPRTDTWWLRPPGA